MKIRTAVLTLPFFALGICQAIPIAGIDIIGTTLGCFGAGCTPVASDTLGGLTFTSGSFSGQTDPAGEFAPGVAGNSLGTYSLTGSAFNYGTFATPSPFTLRLLLTDPAPGNLPGGQDFTADISGVVASSTNGTVSITWPGICHGCGPPVFLYNFSVPQGDGTISVHINPKSFSLTSGSPAPQTAIQDGHFHTDVNVVPEPGAYALVGGALIGLAAFGRKRLNR